MPCPEADGATLMRWRNRDEPHVRASGIAASVARAWIRICTLGMPASLRKRRRAELESMLWEHQRDARRVRDALAHGVHGAALPGASRARVDRAAVASRRLAHARSGVEILAGLFLGMLDDLAWRRERADASSSRHSGEDDPGQPRGGRGSRMSGLSGDIRHAVRLLIKSPAISALIILILALGISLNTAVFSFLETTVTNPFPFPEADRLVDIVRPSHRRTSGDFNFPAFAALRDGNEIFAGVAGYRDGTRSVVIGERRERVWGAEVTAGIFELLGVQPMLGRPFTSDEQGPGAPVAIISHYRWRHWFASDPEVLGRTIEVDGSQRTIIGVMPRGFTFYQPFNGVWIPLPVDATTPLEDPYRFSVVGRVRPGVSLAQAQASMATLGEVIDSLLGEPDNDLDRLRATRSFRIAPLEEGMRIPGRILIGISLQVAAGLVMLVVCANVASLLLVRGLARQREIAVRRALGAPRGRLLRQLVVENLLLALPGAAVGVLVAHWGYDVLRAAIPLLSGVELRLDLRILAFAIGLATGAVLLFGTETALALSRAEPGDALKEWITIAAGSLRARGWQNRLAILQVALSVVLLTGAALAGRSMLALGDVDPGFDARSVFWFFLTDDDQQLPNGYQDVVHRVAEELDASPAIEAVAWRATAPPEAAGTPRDQFGRGFIETQEGFSSLRVSGTTRGGPAVSAGYFRTFGLSLLRGRTFNDQDRPGAPLVAVLSERVAIQLWPGDDPVGKQLRFPGATAWLTVIGVISNVVSVSANNAAGGGSGMQAAPAPDIYLAASQFDNRPINNVIWVRPALAGAPLLPLLGAKIAEVAPAYQIGSLQSVWERDYASRMDDYLAAGRLLGTLGLIAILLSALGTYTVISYAWALRAREMGVRVAFGATRADIFRLVLRDSQKLALIGVLAGTALSLGVYRLAAGFFFGISSWDPISYAGIAILLLAMAALAGLGPARRATKTDPIDVLRQD
jgi:predicted permease